MLAAIVLVAAAPARAPETDSLRLELLQLSVRAAEIEADRTSFWRRLLPRVEGSAGLSAGSVAFAESGAPLVLPRDSYRLSVAVALTGLFDDTPHQEALLQLDRARTELRLGALRLEASVRRRRARVALADSLGGLRRQELALREELVRYEELLFGQGSTGFDAVSRARLALLAARAAALVLPPAGEEETEP
jgi:hypothetical protein